MFNVPAVAFCILLLAELALWLPIKWPRRLLAATLAIELVPFSIWFGLTYANWYILPLLLIVAYRIFNLWRLVAERRHADHMYQVTRRASFWLILAQAVTVYLAITGPLLTQQGLFVTAGLVLVASLVIAAATQRNLSKTRPPAVTPIDPDDLPTVSVLIPARNETDDLAACLTSLVHSTYPKLEIIVLDDCSQNHRTPEIIKGFAHDGVRFIAGDPAPSSWLAKNYAYQQLADAASGDILLYCGVDTRFKSATIEYMVLALHTKKKSMISFIPANIVPSPWSFASMLVQPSRYAWELALPRRSLHLPPVLSSAWMITRLALEEAGSFGAYSRAVIPERYFARHTARHDDGYSFMQSDTKQGVMSTKSFSAQRATAVRTRYPQLHQSLELTVLTSAAELIVLVAPFVMLLAALVMQSWIIFGLALMACLMLTLSYSQIVNITYRRFMVRSLWLLPLSALYDVALLNYSMYKYEFSDVQWKGRNVCIPVMQVIDRLPKV